MEPQFNTVVPYEATRGGHDMEFTGWSDFEGGPDHHGLPHIQNSCREFTHLSPHL